MTPSLPQIVIFAVLFAIIVVPILLCAFSRKVKGTEKLAWVVAAVLFSWVGYIAMVLYIKHRDNPS